MLLIKFIMAIFQFKCDSCSAIFEHLISASNSSDIDCISCGASEISRVDRTYFYPNKVFCPHDKTLDKNKLKVDLSGIMSDKTLSCAGCGTDGSPGKCSSSGGGCGGGCSCKTPCKSPSKLTLEI